MRRSLPKLAPLRHGDCIERCPLSNVTRKTFAHISSQFDPKPTSDLHQIFAVAIAALSLRQNVSLSFGTSDRTDRFHSIEAIELLIQRKKILRSV